MTTNVEIEKVSSGVARKRFRVEDFRRMTEVGILPEESGWEIIDGFLIDKDMSIGSRHVGTVIKISKIFERRVGGETLVSTQNPVHINDYNEPEPDVALLKPRGDFYTESLPTPQDVLLLVEVSDSTVEYDRDIKKALYAEAGIEEFWIVNLKANTIECYSQPKNGNYRLVQILEAGETIESKTIENLSLRVEEVVGL